MGERLGEELVRTDQILLAVTGEDVRPVVECPSGHLGDDGALALAGFARHQQHSPTTAGVPLPDTGHQRPDLLLAPDDADVGPERQPLRQRDALHRGRDRPVGSPCRSGAAGRGRRQPDVRLPEHPLFEVPQLLAGLDPLLLDEDPSDPSVRGQRLRLSTAPVEGDHQLGPQPLAVRVERHQSLEVRHDLRMAAEGQVDVHPELDGLQPSLVEPRALSGGERLVDEVGEGLTPPEVESGPQRQVGGFSVPGTERGRRHPDEALEPHGVHGGGVDVEDVARLLADQGVVPVCPQDRPEPRHVRVECPERRRWRCIRPDLVDDPVRRHDRPDVEDEQGQHRPLSTTPECQRHAVAAHLEGSQQPVLRRPGPHHSPTVGCRPVAP